MTSATTTRPHRSRLTERDADYLRLRDATARRLTSSVQRLVRELRHPGPGGQTVALHDFIQRQTAILQDAYIASVREGARDYFQETSATPDAWAKSVAVNPERMRSALAFYAPSIAKMAHEALRAYTAVSTQAPGVRLEELIADAEETVRLFSIGGALRGLFGGRGGGGAHGMPGMHQDGRETLRNSKGEYQGSTKGAPKEKSPVGRLGHGAKVEFLHGSEAQARENFRSLFKRDLADHEIASLVGARPGDAVRITGASGGRDRVAMVHLTLVGEHGDYTAYRSIFRNVDGDPERNGPRGKVVMNNNEFHVSNTGHGVGAEVLGRQTAALSRLGVAQINTRAEGRGNINLPRHGLLHGEMVGYYTWPRLGYNGKISDISGAATSQHIKDAPEFRNAKTVRDIMRVARVALPKDMQFHDENGALITHLSGREWWRRFGSGFGAHFDLKPGSESMKILDTYLAERGITIDMSEHNHYSIRLTDDPDATGHEEIEWTDEDEAAAERAWRKLYPELTPSENDDATRQDEDNEDESEPQ